MNSWGNKEASQAWVSLFSCPPRNSAERRAGEGLRLQAISEPFRGFSVCSGRSLEPPGTSIAASLFAGKPNHHKQSRLVSDALLPHSLQERGTLMFLSPSGSRDLIEAQGMPSNQSVTSLWPLVPQPLGPVRAQRNQGSSKLFSQRNDHFVVLRILSSCSTNPEGELG